MRSKRLSDATDRTFVLVFEAGDEPISELTRFARESGLSGSHFTAIGAFARVVLGFFELERKDYRRIGIDEQVEVLSLVGNVALGASGPQVHAHVVVGKADGTAHGGHLLEATVRPTLEVTLTEAPRHLVRKVDPETRLALIDLERDPAPS